MPPLFFSDPQSETYERYAAVCRMGKTMIDMKMKWKQDDPSSLRGA
jgi:hypothetical protein